MSVKLEDRLRTAIRAKRYSPKTEDAYVAWYKRFVRFHGLKHPSNMGENEIGAFINNLAVNKDLSGSSINQAVCAIIFLYKQVLKTDVGEFSIPRQKRNKRMPVVLSQDEVARLLDVMDYTPHRDWLSAALMYGAGLRLNECLSLRVKDIDFDRMSLSVRCGKGGKDREVPLPAMVRDRLNQHLKAVRKIHFNDLQHGFGSVILPGQLHKKYPNACREWVWQYVFAADQISTDPKTGHKGRWHVFDTTIQRAVKVAVKKANIAKHASCHTLRHSFATHLVEAGYDIRTVQELMGHNSLNTTMIYVHIVNASRGVKSPLDILSNNGLYGVKNQDVDVGIKNIRQI